MSTDDLLFSIIGALAGAIVGFYWGLRILDPKERRRSFWLMYLVTHAPVFAVAAYVYLALPSNADEMARTLRVIWVTCGFLAGGLAGLVAAGIQRMLTRRRR